MRIDSLQTQHFRHLKSAAALAFHPKLNIISGKTGSGKTALLEALYCLGRGKSFRTAQVRHMIAYQQSYFRLIAELSDQDGNYFLGMERRARGYQVRLDGQTLNGLSALAALLPVHIVYADHFSLLTAAPQDRRRFLDYGLFFDDAAFLPLWQRYQYALKGRNRALMEAWQDHYIRSWHPLLAETAEKIDVLRHDYLKRLENRLNQYHAHLGGLQTLRIRYDRGWHGDLRQTLDENLARDQQIKYTRDGIHRADWRLFCEDYDIAHTFSRGQQKTVLCALILSQADEIRARSKKVPVILVDDITAELDIERQQLLLRFLQASEAQLFITALEANLLTISDADCKQFYLDRGHIQQIS